jgi:hypothetical protein
MSALRLAPAQLPTSTPSTAGDRSGTGTVDRLSTSRLEDRPRAEALVADQGAKARAGVEQAPKRASTIVEEIGARVYEPQIAEGRACLAEASRDAGAAERHLRDAGRIYAETGASGHARRLAAELAA